MGMKRLLVICSVMSTLVVSQHIYDYSNDRASSTASRDWGPWTGWSVCSETCGYGTAYRIRQCHAHHRSRDISDCNGPSKQYKLCIIKNCTHGASDYRSKECAKHNNVYYGKQTYTWVPYFNDASPCELSCKSVGYGYYARFKKNVADFVICNEENTAVCIRGKCVESGCDGILGSGTQIDRCGVCGGDGITCRVIRGIFTRTHLAHRGYNIVTTIPKGACSVNITEMSRSNNHLALSTPAGYFLNGDMRLQAEGSVKGAGTTFTYNRYTGQSCPGECLTAPGPLNTTLRVELIYFGRNPGIYYQFTIPREETRDVISSMATTHDDQSHPSSRSRDVHGTHKDSSGPATPKMDIIPRIRHGKSPVYLPDNDKGNQRQQLQISSRVTSSRSFDVRPNNFVSGTSSEDHGSLYQYPSRSSLGVSSYNSSRHKSHHRGRKHRKRPHSSTSKPSRRVNVRYEDTKSQYHVKGENGSIEYKHYYHTNAHDGIGDVPMALTRHSGSHRGRLRHEKKPTWRDSNSKHDNRYAEFRGTTQYQSSTQSSLPNAIAASLQKRRHSASGSSRSTSTDRHRYYDGYDNRVSEGDQNLYSWRISGFTECSEPCGGGLQDTRVICVKGDSQVEVIEENCDENLKPASSTFVCNNQPCDAGWVIGDWTECSVTCGRGLQKRTVECKQRISPTLTLAVSARNCPRPQPQTRQYCQLESCFRWQVSDWEKCSTECGFGQRRRTVSCVNIDGETVNESMCTETQPADEEICDMGSCAQGWFHTRWSKECSAECGRGRYTRQVYCSAADGSKLDERKCGGKDKKPREHKSCKASKPCGGQWFTGPWTSCNSTCGSDAYRQRDVLCIKQHSKKVRQVVKEHNCVKEDKPHSLEACGPFPRCEPQWYMMSWSECSKSCGTGVRTREVKCLDVTFTASPDCDKAQKPSRRQSCNTQPCMEKYAAFSESTEATTNEALQMDGSSVPAKAHSACKDSQASRWCQLAKQARLCIIPHYKKICCHTCRKLDPKPH